MVERNSDVLSANFRALNGSVDITADSGARSEEVSDRNRVVVPIFRDDQRWGAVEIQFAAVEAPWLPGFANNTFLLLVLFVFATGAFLFPLFLKRVLKELDPSKVIPARVKAAFDTLAEGILILDERGIIVLANKAFSRHSASAQTRPMSITRTSCDLSIRCSTGSSAVGDRVRAS